MEFLAGGPLWVHPCPGLSSGQPYSWDERAKMEIGTGDLGLHMLFRAPLPGWCRQRMGLLERSKPWMATVTLNHSLSELVSYRKAAFHSNMESQQWFLFESVPLLE